MEEYRKDELFFLILTSIQCTLPFGAMWLVRNYFETPTYQRLTVGICVFLLVATYRYGHRLLNKPIGNQYYVYLLISIIVSYSLGGFSQEELHQFGFNFSPEPKIAAIEYLQLKAMFNAIAVICLPTVLRQTFKKLLV